MYYWMKKKEIAVADSREKNRFLWGQSSNEIYFWDYINDCYLDGHFNFIKVIEENTTMRNSKL